MPIYNYECDNCQKAVESFHGISESPPLCCGSEMRKIFDSHFMVKVKGEGGYPSRRRQVFNTTSRKHPELEHKKNTVYYGG